MQIYETIKGRLPKTYPRPKLAFYEDEDSLADDNDIKKDYINLFGVCDPDSNMIKLPLTMEIEYKSKGGKVKRKKTPITKIDESEIVHTLLHEICHAYYGEKYGYSSKKYNDEEGCDRFAIRWMYKLLKEKLI
jgi:hypothetical protein